MRRPGRRPGPTRQDDRRRSSSAPGSPADGGRATVLDAGCGSDGSLPEPGACPAANAPIAVGAELGRRTIAGSDGSPATSTGAADLGSSSTPGRRVSRPGDPSHLGPRARRISPISSGLVTWSPGGDAGPGRRSRRAVAPGDRAARERRAEITSASPGVRQARPSPQPRTRIYAGREAAAARTRRRDPGRRAVWDAVRVCRDRPGAARSRARPDRPFVALGAPPGATCARVRDAARPRRRTRPRLDGRHARPR